MVPVRRVLACFLGSLVLAAALPAQPQEELIVHAYSLRYQQAIDAIPVIQPLLSKRGTIELQPAGNTLVIRDTPAALGQIMPRLRSFDHPAQALRLEITIVRASRSAVSPQERSDLPDELVARLRAVMRRAQPGGAQNVLQFADVEVDTAAHRVSRGGRSIHLGPTEFRLLRYLITHPGRVFSREQLLDAVWGHDVYVEARTVDVHIRRLRKALNADDAVDVVRTVRSAGYALDHPVR